MAPETDLQSLTYTREKEIAFDCCVSTSTINSEYFPLKLYVNARLSGHYIRKPEAALCPTTRVHMFKLYSSRLLPCLFQREPQRQPRPLCQDLRHTRVPLRSGIESKRRGREGGREGRKEHLRTSRSTERPTERSRHTMHLHLRPQPPRSCYVSPRPTDRPP